MSPAAEGSLTATVVAIVSRDGDRGVSETLASLASVAGVRPVIVSLGELPEPRRREEGGAIVIDGLLRRYLNNAVASLRVSSLPTLAWWRAGDPQGLPSLAALVDRVVMDLEEPSPAWAMVPAIAPLASVSDLRWARLTRWRDLVAQLADVTEVRGSLSAFDRVEIAGADAHTTRLLGGWLRARLPQGQALAVVTREAPAARVVGLRLSGPKGAVSVRLKRNGICLETTVDIPPGAAAVRVVALGDQRLPTLLGEELRVRSRDVAFEDAVREAEKL